MDRKTNQRTTSSACSPQQGLRPATPDCLPRRDLRPAEERSGAPFPLSDLPLGTGARVDSVSGAEDLRRRLLEMGFCNRAVVTAIRRAPLGDPTEFSVRGYFVSLRRDEAGCVLVVAESDAPDDGPAHK